MDEYLELVRLAFTAQTCSICSMFYQVISGSALYVDAFRNSFFVNFDTDTKILELHVKIPETFQQMHQKSFNFGMEIFTKDG